MTPNLSSRTSRLPALCLLLVLCTGAASALELDGTLRGDRVLGPADSPVVIRDSLLVPEGLSLTLEAGTVLKMGPGAVLRVEGELQALGEKRQPVEFDWLEEGQYWGNVSIHGQKDLPSYDGDFNYIPGQNDNYKRANQPENLITLCPSCHKQAEAGQQARSALGGLAYVLRNLAPLYLMCDPGDIEVVAESRSPLTQAPTIVIYESVSVGVGFSPRLFEIHHDLLPAALELVSDCRCRDGCPACVGPPGEIGPDTKQVTRQLLQMLT